MQANNSDPRRIVGTDEYRKMRRAVQDDLIDREIRRRHRCEKTHKVLSKLGLAILTGAVPALVAGLLGWIDRISEVVSAVLASIFHGGAPR